MREMPYRTPDPPAEIRNPRTGFEIFSLRKSSQMEGRIVSGDYSPAYLHWRSMRSRIMRQSKSSSTTSTLSPAGENPSGCARRLLLPLLEVVVSSAAATLNGLSGFMMTITAITTTTTATTTTTTRPPRHNEKQRKTTKKPTRSNLTTSRSSNPLATS